MTTEPKTDLRRWIVRRVNGLIPDIQFDLFAETAEQAAIDAARSVEYVFLIGKLAEPMPFVFSRTKTYDFNVWPFGVDEGTKPVFVRVSAGTRVAFEALVLEGDQ